MEMAGQAIRHPGRLAQCHEPYLYVLAASIDIAVMAELRNINAQVT